jgi:hypothetical protein
MDLETTIHKTVLSSQANRTFDIYTIDDNTISILVKVDFPDWKAIQTLSKYFTIQTLAMDTCTTLDETVLEKVERIELSVSIYSDMKLSSTSVTHLFILGDERGTIKLDLPNLTHFETSCIPMPKIEWKNKNENMVTTLRGDSKWTLEYGLACEFDRIVCEGEDRLVISIQQMVNISTGFQPSELVFEHANTLNLVCMVLLASLIPKVTVKYDASRLYRPYFARLLEKKLEELAKEGCTAYSTNLIQRHRHPECAIYQIFKEQIDRNYNRSVSLYELNSTCYQELAK